MDAARKDGPLVVFDAGNALFKHPGVSNAGLEARARFILAKLSGLGVKVMGVGARDLNAGAVWLKREAEKVGIEPLSANVVGTDGKPLFKASAVLKEGGLRLGFIGATAVGPHAEATAHPALPLVRAEAQKLKGKADLVVVLAALSYGDALQLSNELGGAVDFVIQSHEGRGMGMAQKGPGNWVLPSGERGRQLARVDLDAAGKGPFNDLGEAERAAHSVQILKGQLQEVERRKAAATAPETKAALDRTRQEFLQRLKQAEAEARAATTGRAFKLQFVNLGREVKDDPRWMAEVDRIDPPGSRGH